MALSKVSTQGVPGGFWDLSAELIVYQGNQVVDRRTLTPSSPSTTLQLQTSQTYSFELSVKANDTEVAWVRDTRPIQGDTTLSLRPRAIVRKVYLYPDTSLGPVSLKENESIRINLGVETPAGIASAFPQGDLENVTYQAIGNAEVLTDPDLKTAVLLRAKPGSGGTEVGARVTLQALGPNRQLQTFTEEIQIAVLPTSLPNNDGRQIQGNVANLQPGYLSQPVPIRALGGPQRSTDLGIWGQLNPDSSFQVQLPPGAYLNQEAFGPIQFEGMSCSWSNAPETVNVLLVDFKLASGSDLVLANNLNFYQPGNTRAFFLYADRDFSAQGVCTTSNSTYNFNIAWVKGWNIMKITSNNTDLLYDGQPFSGSLPQDLQWFLYPEPGSGGSGGGSANVGISLDLAPPYGYIGPDGPGPFQANTLLTLSGHAEDETSLQGVKLLINLQPVPLQVQKVSATQWNLSATWTPQAPGRYYIDLIVEDAGGNTYTHTLSLQVN